MAIQLIADSGATKCEWCLIDNDIRKTVFTAGVSPYFLTEKQIVELLIQDLLPELNQVQVEEVYFYGTGLGNPQNVTVILASLSNIFPAA